MGDLQHALARCDNNLWACIDIYQITESPAASILIDRMVVTGETRLQGLYLLDRDRNSAMDTLVAIGTRGCYAPYWDWPGSWRNKRSSPLKYPKARTCKHTLLNPIQ